MSDYIECIPVSETQWMIYDMSIGRNENLIFTKETFEKAFEDLKKGSDFLVFRECDKENGIHCKVLKIVEGKNVDVHFNLVERVVLVDMKQV